MHGIVSEEIGIGIAVVHGLLFWSYVRPGLDSLKRITRSLASTRHLADMTNGKTTSLSTKE